MTASQAGQQPRSGGILVVHDRVAGRTRFEIVKLYRSPRVKRRLERGLGALGAVQRIEANARTGRLLLEYDPVVTLDEIVHRIAVVLGVAPQPAARVDPNGRKRGRPRLTVGDVLQGVADLVRPVEPLPAAVAGFHADGESATQTQVIEPWHLLRLDALIKQLGSSPDTGLSADAAGVRLRRYGPNSLAAAQRRSDLSIFIGQFNSLPVGLLGVSALVSFITGGALDAAVIIGVVLINSVIGFITERQAEKTISSLSETGVRAVNVLRDGQVRLVPVETLVPGDVLELIPGSYIAADIRLLNGHRLSIDESALTGESMPVSKDHKFLGSEDTALGDRSNMAYMGTHVTGGSGRGMVVATAAATELGQIQTMVGEAEAPETPMQKQLDRMGTQLALLSGGVCAGVFGVGVLRGFAWMEMLKSSVSLAVAAVPEGLPAVATTTLAMGISDMRKHNVAVRHLDAVETLGSVQVFCMDKTGTLTMNRMAVVMVHGGGVEYAVRDGRYLRDGEPVDPMQHEELVRLMQVVSLCSETEVRVSLNQVELDGSPTEKALVELGLNAGIDVNALRAEHPTLRIRYRAEGRPFMSTLHPYRDGKHLLAVKGSPDRVLAMCESVLVDGECIKLTDEARAAITDQNERMAGEALRVLGVAYREQDEARMPSRTGRLVWLGLAGMADPMRSGMDKLIGKFHRAGIETIMITGDQSATAYAIGKQLGLSGDRPLQVLESSKLDDMEPELLAGLAKNVHVFARVSPAHKLKIVRALQEAGYVVAMTGDGINDGPALKAADIGVAMGGGGTNVARDVSDVVLEDDNLHTMTTAVRQGRTIYNNIRKMIHFMVSTNLTEIEVMLAGVAFNLGQPMNPMQLLWINLVTDIFPGLALAMEPAEPGVMKRPPRDPNEAIIEGSDLGRMVFESGTIGVGTFGAYLYGVRRYGIGAAASTLAFNTLTLNELAHALSARSEYRHVFGGHKMPPNPHLVKAIGGMAGLQLLVSLVPGARRLLGTSPLGLTDLIAIGAGVLGPLIVNEMTKPKAPAAEDEEEMLSIGQPGEEAP